VKQKSLRILIIEDDEDDAFYIKDILKEGLGDPAPLIDHFSTLGSGLVQLNPFQYDLAMFDYRLGEINGIQLIRNIRELSCDIPIILFTGQGDQEVAVEAMKAGATDYLVKGKITAESVIQSIRYALGLRKEGALRKEAETKLKNPHMDLTLSHQELQASMEKLKKAQNQILRSEKLAGIGRMVAGVCHEILNPLNIISGHSQTLLLERNNDGELCKDLDSIMEEIQRITKIIGSLLKFSRKGSMELVKTDITKELESVLSLVKKDMQMEGISIVQNFSADSIPVHIDTDGMRQVFLNIINNAKFAMQGGGVFTISTEVLNSKENWSPYQEKVLPGPDKIMRLKFSDTGAGIRAEDMEKLFEPFFTTKPEEKGTGLGLSVSFSIIEKHGGRLEIESELGLGTTVIIDLPCKKDDI
jgi:two-component system, NtrC family, sensor kinase